MGGKKEASGVSRCSIFRPRIDSLRPHTWKYLLKTQTQIFVSSALDKSIRQISPGPSRFVATLRVYRWVPEHFSVLGADGGGRFEIGIGGTSTRAPVFGLRPMRARLWRVWKLPNPRISTLSPDRRARTMLSNMAQTTASDSFWLATQWLGKPLRSDRPWSSGATSLHHERRRGSPSIAHASSPRSNCLIGQSQSIVRVFTHRRSSISMKLMQPSPFRPNVPVRPSARSLFCASPSVSPPAPGRPCPSLEIRDFTISGVGSACGFFFGIQAHCIQNGRANAVTAGSQEEVGN